ncbi:GDSL-type esterase/lipase family protein [Paenibacillus sp. MER TA 81-3]|uniref:GDSL-type esterase/lipase family protein n=1 Tax=Paenibacillus sp. MER TA 81-3 TaxID=2939573 RepID=UPI0020404B4A|nr:GDSL-type esterase/lipase family protein [Paenibacillus sp. MER TA 81-3]MCM3341247.1 GDSL-type esterase/lipase family protein [Paenibacillus sp. MER TA 81-3]
MNRKSTSRLWSWIALFGLLSTLVLAVGFGFGVADILSPASVPFTEMPSVQTPPVKETAQADEWLIATIGDSLTRGTGDGTGEGYVRRVVKMLDKVQDKPVTLLNNMAVNGMRADQLSERLNQESIGYVLKKANIVLLTIGGNDLFQSARSEQFGDQSLNQDTLLAKADQGVGHLKKVFAGIRKWNPDALIVYVGLYNPFTDLEEMREIGNNVVQKWNDAAFQMINKDKNMIMVPTFDLFQQNIGMYLSSDHFHPNGDGYQAIAERIVQSIR